MGEFSSISVSHNTFSALDGFSEMDKSMPKELRPRVSVIIVTYGSSKDVPDCVDSLLRQSVPIEIFLVDNASLDNTAEVVSDYAERYENVHAILNEDNVGLAAGNNVPMGLCQGEYLLMLNPDTLFRDDSLQRMIEFLDKNPDVGVAGPRNVYPDGEPHVSFRSSWDIGDILMWRVLPYRFPRFLHDRLSSYKTQDVLFISGSCLLIRRNIFQRIGGYDPEYFLSIEDVCDLCIRVKQTGSRVVFLGDQEVVHLTGRSGVQAPYIVVWHGLQGSVYHFLKHRGIFQALIVSFLLLSACAARIAIAAMLGIVSERYRNVARIYARVFWCLLVKNPILTWRSRLSASPGNAV
ncbi:MAG: glycosyltransferase family 2 protein [Candidatus Sulfotelmatobacter sp.]